MTEGREIIVHRVGTPESPHFTSVRDFHGYLTAVLMAHEPTEERPEAMLEFPGGWWCTLVTDPQRPTPKLPGGKSPQPETGLADLG